MPDARDEILTRLAKGKDGRTEADIQGDIYALLTTAGLALAPDQVARLEVPTKDGTRRRLDIEIGHAVIEIKRDLRARGARQDAEHQLAGYVASRAELLGRRYVGILTDGANWHLYHLSGEALEEVAALSLNSSRPDAGRLTVWLEGILATDRDIKPSALELKRRFGSDSPAHLLNHASLHSLYVRDRDSADTRLKRELWAKLLRTAFGKGFDDDEYLFIDHTLLVLSAEIIAHAVVGFDVSRVGPLTPQALARGTAFADSLVHGVVEADFFDWVLDIDGGPEFVSSLADQIGRFDWSHVDHDVLKVLYESIIPPAARASLGEYYTPDWLAERIVEEAIDQPLQRRVLDPACGSGTFLFHAIRRYLRSADDAGLAAGAAIRGLANHVVGMDVHPVAVTLARVTYLLAIGRERLLAEDRGALSVPVYLGDSLQWEQHRDLLGGVDEVAISTTGDDLVDGGGGMLFGDDLVFPRAVLQDAAGFDQLVTALADKAKQATTRSPRDHIMPTLLQFGVHERDLDRLVETFDTMRRLHRSGRDHIWGYYVRNLIRPLWLSEPANQFDVLIGNPPWLRYGRMTAAMQDRFKSLSKDLGLLTGSLGASGRDLATLFAARAVELYLRPGGRLALVMPHGTLSRKPHQKFRTGNWGSRDHGAVSIAFDQAWDLSRAPTGFPMVSCVIWGKRAPVASGLPHTVKVWSARLKTTSGSWSDVAGSFTVEETKIASHGEDNLVSASAYKKRFRQGAVLAPNVLLFVEPVQGAPLGAGVGRLFVQSRRSNLEKKPWKDLDSISGAVEKSFVRNVYLSESVLPYRLTTPRTAVLPLAATGLLSPEEIEHHAALSSWWETVEENWANHKSDGDTSTLLDRIDFHGQLSSQIPASAHRVVYTKAGNNLAAARIHDAAALIDFSLYWCATSGPDEALYLTAILNSTAVLDRVRPLQTQGLFGARHFDKYIFSISIPTFDSAVPEHSELTELARQCESAAGEVDVSSSADFKRSRSAIRAQLQELTEQVDQAVLKVIKPVAD